MPSFVLQEEFIFKKQKDTWNENTTYRKYKITIFLLHITIRFVIFKGHMTRMHIQILLVKMTMRFQMLQSHQLYCDILELFLSL